MTLITTAGVAGVGRAGQRLQGGQHGVAGLGLQEPVDRDHAVQGRGQPQAPAGMTTLSLGVGPVGVGHLEQVPDGLTQPRRVHPDSGLHQDRLGVGHELVGQGPGALGEHPGMASREHPTHQRLGGLREGAAEQRPGGPDRLPGCPRGHAEAVA
jgi:hypothetical protein